MGYQGEYWRYDVAYSYEFSPEVFVGSSGYRAGEYSNSSLQVQAHGLAVSVGRRF